ncbi:unnamed protein product [Effrenium voratum]|uniref:Uncharacterized protein n=1 Tax=Effrenium voratum TaxID=2562239 RepID=A0AA36NHF6_9DINO|nr:unnamed protein product [Effrenium voratum]
MKAASTRLRAAEIIDIAFLDRIRLPPRSLTLQQSRLMQAEKTNVRERYFEHQSEIVISRMRMHVFLVGLEANLALVRKEVEQRVSKQAVLEEHSAGLQRQLDHALAEKVKSEAWISSQHVEILTLQQLHGELQAEKAHSQSVTQKMDGLEIELARYHKEKEELDQMVGSLHAECAKVRAQRDSAMAEVPHLKASLQQQETLLRDQEAQVVALQHRLKMLQDANGALNKEAKRLALCLERCQEEGAQAAQAAASLRAEKAQLLQALQRLEHIKAQSDACYQSANNESGVLQARCQQMHSEREQLQIRLQQSASENSALRSRVVGLEKMVHDDAAELQALQQKVLGLQGEKAQMEQMHESQMHKSSSTNHLSGVPHSQGPAL